MEETEDDRGSDGNHRNDETPDEKGDKDNDEERDGNEPENEKTNDVNYGKSIEGAEYVAMKENVDKYLANPRDGRKTGSNPKAGGREQRWAATH